jgi:hypothetical protein
MIHRWFTPNFNLLSSFVLVSGFAFAIAVLIRVKGIGLGSAIITYLYTRRRLAREPHKINTLPILMGNKLS